MKKIFFYTLVFFLSLHIKASDTTTILLIHPTANNIYTFNYLVKNKIINIKNVKFVGVYHKNEQYNYENSKQIIKDSLYTNFSLVCINQDISKQEVFSENKLSSVFDSLLNISDGAIFTGGDDISPTIYNKKTSFLTEIDDPFRHYFEISFLYHLIEKDKGETALLNKKPEYVIWGICLGMQTINIAAKGTMYQDIPTEIYHYKNIEKAAANQQNMHKNYVKRISDDKSQLGGSLHQIILKDEENRIAKIFKTNAQPYVFSWHHQAINKVGNNLKVILMSKDKKVIEGINHTKFKNVYGIQFHPEYKKIWKNIEVKLNDKSEIKGFSDILKEKNSFEFHKEIWRFFSSLF